MSDELKDNEIAEFVNDLTRTAQTFGQTQQLREHIHIDVLNHLPKRTPDPLALLDEVKDIAEKIQDKIYSDEYHKYPEFKTDANDGIQKVIQAIESLQGKYSE